MEPIRYGDLIKHAFHDKLPLSLRDIPLTRETYLASLVREVAVGRRECTL